MAGAGRLQTVQSPFLPRLGCVQHMQAQVEALYNVSIVYDIYGLNLPLSTVWKVNGREYGLQPYLFWVRTVTS
jgi:hypothetical protein